MSTPAEVRVFLQVPVSKFGLEDIQDFLGNQIMQLKMNENTLLASSLTEQKRKMYNYEKVNNAIMVVME
ncbi:hypothetical protein DPMN_170668 [Dreissena polymorpha]|uniref:Uncharacterized protein n=1 Tax=Dreissena polymorpha TaxID=45954 RepID=A0A9D4IBR0_DREPO|nr:hypothetical protein DPMN_170668 [Dreissena polymorpha]